MTAMSCLPSASALHQADRRQAGWSDLV